MATFKFDKSADNYVWRLGGCVFRLDRIDATGQWELWEEHEDAVMIRETFASLELAERRAVDLVVEDAASRMWEAVGCSEAAGRDLQEWYRKHVGAERELNLSVPNSAAPN